MRRIRVKVCGVTRLDDALLAAELGADALGFNFVPGSPRRIGPREARALGRALPPFVQRVGVVADPTDEELRRLAAEAGLDSFQFHGEESPERCAASPLPWFKAFRTGPGFSPDRMAAYPADIHLVDAYRPGALGGTGTQADWALAAEAARRFAIVLAGGLGPDNVVAAVQAVGPAAVDVNSGIESEPGAKDPDAMRRLFSTLAARGLR